MHTRRDAAGATMALAAAFLLILYPSARLGAAPGQTVGTPQNNVLFNPPGIGADGRPNGQPGTIMIPPGNGRFRISLCTGALLGPNAASPRCNPRTADPRLVAGGNNADYVFFVPPGIRLPRGVSVDARGVLTVEPQARGTSVNLPICVHQLNTNAGCNLVGLNQTPPAGSARSIPPPKKKGGVGATALTGLMLGGALAGATYFVVESGILSGLLDDLGGDSCGSPPTIPSSCLGSGRNSASCNTIIANYRTWCSCTGGTFDVSTGSCR